MMAHSFRGHGDVSFTPMKPHGGGPSSYRLPEMTQDTPRITFLGSKGVAATLAGRTDFQNGVMKLKMLPKFFDEFKEHIKSYPGVSGGWEVQLLHYKIERFNEMIVSSEWIPLTREGDAGVFTEPFSPEPATQGRRSARRCGKDGCGVGVARMRAAPPYTASDLLAPSRRSWPVRGSSW